MKTLLLGGTGYVGSAFLNELRKRDWEYVSVSRKQIDYTTPEGFIGLCRGENFGLVVNCAAFIPKQSVSLCDQNQYDTIKGNTVFPAKLSEWCDFLGIPLAHISTGCLWTDGREHSEDDEVQRAFTGHCGFYVGTKVLAEHAVGQIQRHYVWRIRLPFDEIDNERNYITKLATFPEVWNQENSIAHRGDFAKACLDMAGGRVPWGTYHVTNPGFISVDQLVLEMLERRIIKTFPKLVDNSSGACKLSVKKLLSTGIKIRPVEQAVEESLRNWRREG